MHQHRILKIIKICSQNNSTAGKAPRFLATDDAGNPAITKRRETRRRAPHCVCVVVRPSPSGDRFPGWR